MGGVTGGKAKIEAATIAHKIATYLERRVMAQQ
jgi:hypothetical protein